EAPSCRCQDSSRADEVAANPQPHIDRDQAWLVSLDPGPCLWQSARRVSSRLSDSSTGPIIAPTAGSVRNPRLSSRRPALRRATADPGQGRGGRGRNRTLRLRIADPQVVLPPRALMTGSASTRAPSALTSQAEQPKALEIVRVKATGSA